MKAIQLELRHGGWATFFLSSNFSLHERREFKDNSTREIEMIAVLSDGNHNNGGWELADHYEEVHYRLLRLFDMEV